MRMKFLVVLVAISSAMACAETTEDSPFSGERVTTTASASGGKSDAFDDKASVWEEIALRCTAPADDEEVVYNNDFEWGYSHEAMGIRYEEIYHSGKRLHARAYYDETLGSLVLPGTDSWGGDVMLPERLVENVTLHIEHALERGYAEFVFFPDMGHSHLFIPEQHFEDVYAGTPVSEFSRRYERMFDDPQLMVLYTAEQLQMLDEDDQVINDRHIMWRYHTRNPVGDNNYERRLELLTDYTQKANTARDMAEMKYQGAGFNISASEDGCFPFENQHGEIQWYDISLEDLPFDTSGGGGGFDF